MVEGFRVRSDYHISHGVGPGTSTGQQGNEVRKTHAQASWDQVGVRCL